MSEQAFYFDDFFASESDPGIVVPVKIRGRVVPITLRRGLSLADKNAAQQMAITKHLSPTGQMVYDGVNEAVMVEQMLLRAILDWPFVTREGAKVPVTVENIRKLLGGADALAEFIKKLDEDGEEALVPFVPVSDEA